MRAEQWVNKGASVLLQTSDMANRRADTDCLPGVCTPV